MINWGVLSTASIARAEVMPAIMRAENANLYAIASSKSRVQDIAKEFDIPVIYDRYEAILEDPKVDAVYIPLPNHLHKEWVIKAAEKGKHVLCEKPAALTSKDFQEMLDACQKNGVLFMEAFMYQFHPQHKRVKEIIANGEIGEVHHIRSTFSFSLNLGDVDNIRLNPEMGGGSLWDVGCYCVHSTRFLTDEEPIELYVKGTIHPRYGVDTRAAGVITLTNGITASFDCSFEEPMLDCYQITGSKGIITVPYAFRPDVSPTGKGKIIISNEAGESRKEWIDGDQYKRQIEHFSSCILEKVEPEYSGKHALRNIQAMEACYQSIKTRQIVVLDLK